MPAQGVVETAILPPGAYWLSRGSTYTYGYLTENEDETSQIMLFNFFIFFLFLKLTCQARWWQLLLTGKKLMVVQAQYKLRQSSSTSSLVNSLRFETDLKHPPGL